MLPLIYSKHARVKRSEIDKSRKCHFEAVSGEAGAVQKAIESFYFLLIFFILLRYTSMFFGLAKLGFSVVSPKFHIR